MIPTLHVVAAVIKRDNRIFAAARGYGEYKGKWEFPGGKVETGETPEDAVRREIREELGCEIRVDGFLDTVEWDYPKFRLSMDCFLCSIERGEPVLLEAEEGRWLSGEELLLVDWLPADRALVEKGMPGMTG